MSGEADTADLSSYRLSGSVTGLFTEGSDSNGKILPSFRSGAFDGYKPNGSRIGRSLSAPIDDMAAGFAREEAPLRGEKAEPVAVVAARARRVYFIVIAVVSCDDVLLIS